MWKQCSPASPTLASGGSSGGDAGGASGFLLAYLAMSDAFPRSLPSVSFLTQVVHATVSPVDTVLASQHASD